MNMAFTAIGRDDDAPPVDGIYLRSFLGPFQAWLGRGDVTEIIVNRPGEIWIERAGAPRMERYDAPSIDEALLRRLAHQIARRSHQGISRQQPLLAATLPEGERVQVIGPPATRGGYALAIRKHVMSNLSLEDFSRAGAFTGVQRARAGVRSDIDQDLEALLARRDMTAFLRAAVLARKTVLLSGGTSSGKTTLLNALLKEVPEHERVIVVEDTPEIQLDRANAVGLVAVHGDQGEARIDIDDLMRASLRMRPDRLIVGELRGAEVVTFLRAINTGHPGSFATIHASSAEGAFEQIAIMCLQAGLGLSRVETIAHARSMIDIVVQLERRDGVRKVTEIAFSPR